MAKILICDDSRFMLTLFEKGLVAAGLEVVGKALDGNECIALYQKLKPDLILLDITMPNKDGRDCLKELLKIDSQAKVVMVTAVGDEAVRAECLKLGAKDFIAKTKLSSPASFNLAVQETLLPILKIETSNAPKGSKAS